MFAPKSDFIIRSILFIEIPHAHSIIALDSNRIGSGIEHNDCARITWPQIVTHNLKDSHSFSFPIQLNENGYDSNTNSNFVSFFFCYRLFFPSRISTPTVHYTLSRFFFLRRAFKTTLAAQSVEEASYYCSGSAITLQINDIYIFSVSTATVLFARICCY